MIRFFKQQPLFGLAVLLVAVLAGNGPPAGATELATPVIHSSGVDFHVHVDYSRAILTVSGTDVTVRRELEPGEALSIELFDLAGELLPDGAYTWELRLVPAVDLARGLREEATFNGGEAPGAWRPEGGVFTVQGGEIVLPDVAEPSPPRSASGLEAGAGPHAAARTFRRLGAAIDDDASVGSREGVEEAARAAAARANPAAPGEISLSERSDAAALSLGGSLEPKMQPGDHPNGSRATAPPAERSIDPEGKNGRPRSKDEVR